MKKCVVAVGSKSDLKARAVKNAFLLLGLNPELKLCEVESDVGVQPRGMDIIEIGARNRATGACRQVLGADFFIGVESGLVQVSRAWFDVPAAVAFDAKRRMSVAFGAFFPIPSHIIEKVFGEKSELGAIAQRICGGTEKDAQFYLSDHLVPREELIKQAVMCALVPLICESNYARE